MQVFGCDRVDHPFIGGHNDRTIGKGARDEGSESKEKEAGKEDDGTCEANRKLACGVVPKLLLYRERIFRSGFLSCIVTR